MSEEVRLLWIVEHVRLRRVGVAKAAELAAMPTAAFMRVLGEHGAAVIDYPARRAASNFLAQRAAVEFADGSPLGGHPTTVRLVGNDRKASARIAATTGSTKGVSCPCQPQIVDLTISTPSRA